MAERPYTLLSCGMSIDGYLDSATEKPLLLSNEADFDRVDAVRASCDAILVGAAHGPERQPAAAGPLRRRGGTTGWPAGCRRRRSRSPSPERDELDASAAFFAAGDAEKLVYCASAARGRGRGAARLRGDRRRRRPAGGPALDVRGPVRAAACGG